MKRLILLTLLMTTLLHPAFSSTVEEDRAAAVADEKLDQLIVESDISKMKLDIAQLRRDVDELQRKARI